MTIHPFVIEYIIETYESRTILKNNHGPLKTTKKL